MSSGVRNGRRTRKAWWLAAVVLVLAWLGGMPTSGAAFRGTGGGTSTSYAARATFGLTQTAACHSKGGVNGCTTAIGITQVEHVTVSPDGAHVYTGALAADAVAAFSRNATTGALTQLASPNACVSQAATTGCTTATGLNGVYDLAVSPDGKHLYATGYTSDTVAAFSRNAATGVLTQLASPNACVSGATLTGCTVATGLNGVNGVAISPDGAYVYVAAYDASSLTVFSRNATSGALTQLAGSAGCITDASAPITGCATARGLANPYFLQVSPDGGGLYVAGYGSDAITVFDRDPATGVLTQPAAPNACVYNSGSTAITGCTAAVGLLGTYHVQVAPDSRTVYAVGYDGHTVAAFTRNTTTSALTQLASPNACYYNSGGTAPAGCTSVRAIGSPTGIAFSADGRRLFVSSFGSEAVAVFQHDNTTGVLTQLPLTNGCFAVSLTGCTTGLGVQQGLGIAVSPDSRDVYSVGGNYSGQGAGYIAVLNLTH